VGTVFLKTSFAPGLTLGDWVSLTIPWLVMGSVMLVWDATPAGQGTGHASRRLLLASALLYTTGFGVNLAANAIGRWLSERAPVQPSMLTYFLDEHLGHVLWHLGMIGATLALLLAARSLPPVPSVLRLGPGPLLGAVAYAFAYFTDAVEGQTVPLLLPVCVLLVGGLLAGAPGSRSIIGRFVLVAQGVALLFFLVWLFWQGGFPQFSDVWGI
jgi:hypothetical protein